LIGRESEGKGHPEAEQIKKRIRGFLISGGRTIMMAMGTLLT
jgi:hypothetical protein